VTRLRQRLRRARERDGTVGRSDIQTGDGSEQVKNEVGRPRTDSRMFGRSDIQTGDGRE